MITEVTQRYEVHVGSCLIAPVPLIRPLIVWYIELNPVRAAMAERPEDYPWSSVHANLNRHRDDLVMPHASYLGLHNDPDARAAAYLTWLREGVSDDDLALIRAHLAQERALGDRTFQSMVERTLGRHAAVRPRGRPRRDSREP